MVTLTIDKRTVTVPEGTTIADAARLIHIEIPTLCYLKDINEIGACRICCVEAEGCDQLVPACDTPVAEGMVIYTNSSRVRKSRETNLRLILSQHDVNCTGCTRNGNCKLQKLAADHNIIGNLYKKDLKDVSVERNSPIIRYENKCVKCMRCIQVCDNIQKMHILDLIGSGSRAKVGVAGVNKLTDSACTFCGQCLTHCPVGALEERNDTNKVYKAIDNNDLITVVQIAPAVRTSWAEYYGLGSNDVSTEHLVSALKEIGFDYIFDTNFAADLTIMEEGSEFIHRFTHREDYKWPMFTSCCPGWVRFLKGQYPEYVSNLSTAKSPQQMFGAIAKTYFAEKLGVDPRNIFVVSIMPCTAKKAEAALNTMHDVYDDPDVDVVLTTREMVRMLRTAHINPAELDKTPFDTPLGTGTGAAVVFGATGGVMDAALRTAYSMITGSNPDPDTFYAVRGMDGWKEAKFDIPGVGEISVAIVSGLGNTRNLMEAIKSNRLSYDFVEVMACPGGCAGGGGQPIHDGVEMADTRGQVLWRLDKNQTIRFSHENPYIQMLYREYLDSPLGEKSHHLLHTDHTGWKMPNE